MIFHSLFSSPDKEKIVNIILTECYKNVFSSTDVVIATDHIPVRVHEFKKIYNRSKIIVYLVDLVLHQYLYQQIDLLREADEIWTTEPDIVNLCLRDGLTAKHVPLLHTPRLQYTINEKNPSIDCLLYGPLDFYNSLVLKCLIDFNINVFQTENFDVFNEHLADTKIVLLLPQMSTYQNQSIIQYLISNYKCIVTRKGIINHYPSVIETTDNELFPTIFYLLEKDNWKNHVFQKYNDIVINTDIKLNTISSE